MNRTTLYPAISATVFGIVSLAHLSRLALGWSLEVAHSEAPAWLSLVGFLGAAAFSAWGFSLARAGRRGA